MNSDIRKNRTADVTLTLLQADGTSLANQELVVRQTRRQFLFGTAAFDLVPLANREYSGAALERAEQRAAKLTALLMLHGIRPATHDLDLDEDVHARFLA